MVRLQRLVYGAFGPRHMASTLVAMGIAAIAFVGVGTVLDSPWMRGLSLLVVIGAIVPIGLGLSQLRHDWLPHQSPTGPSAMGWMALGVLLLFGMLWPTGERIEPTSRYQPPTLSDAPAPGVGPFDAP